jgi:hypothetical protein
MSSRDELTTLILGKTAPRAADAVLAAGYRKPEIIGYVVVDRDGKAVRNFDEQAAAEKFAAEYTEDCKDAGIDWDYRVATITEAQQ